MLKILIYHLLYKPYFKYNQCVATENAADFADKALTMFNQMLAWQGLSQYAKENNMVLIFDEIETFYLLKKADNIVENIAK